MIRFASIVVVLAACGGSTSQQGTGDDTPGDDVSPSGDASIGDDGAPVGDAGGQLDGSVTTDSAPPDGPPVVDTCPASTWCLEQAPVANTLYAVAAISADDVFAVGVGGTILRRHAGVWTATASGTTADLYGVWAASSTDAWAVGLNNTVLRWNGTAWSAMAGPGSATTAFNGVWGSSATNVVVVGGVRAYTWNGTAWSNKAFGGTPNTVHGSGANNVWVATENGGVGHYNGTTWANDFTQGSVIFSAYALSPSDVWIAEQTTDTSHWNGSSWTSHAAGSTSFNDFYATATNDVWGVFQTKVGHWEGTAWAVAAPVIGSTTNTATLTAVDGAGGNVWIVGHDGTILRRH